MVPTEAVFYRLNRYYCYKIDLTEINNKPIKIPEILLLSMNLRHSIVIFISVFIQKPILNKYFYIFVFTKLLELRGKSVCSWCDGSSDQSFMVDPLSYFLFQPVLHVWCNKGCGMCYPVCGMMHIKEPLLLIGKSSPCGGSGFPISLSEWSFTICMTPYNRK